ncbi:MAG: hypothetical protein D6729_03585 [Deltaproteobacteria bacterium]|nr:MAG: hypothetical protein D6729_03585 [Deltaproteobacteria bacterium]
MASACASGPVPIRFLPISILAAWLLACGAPVDTDASDAGGQDGGLEDGGGPSDGGTTDGGSSDGGGNPDGGGAGPGPYWYRDVLPVVNQNCLGCHVSGGIAPFSLERYEDAATLSGLLADAVEARRMPPWNPAPGCQPYKNERRLTDAEIQLFRAWHEAGAPAGDPADAPPEGPPPPPELDRVDLVVDPGVDYTPNDQGQNDDYRCFLIDPGLTETKFITGVHVKPGTGYMVHHVLLYGGDRADAQQLDDREPGPGWTCFGGPGTGTPETLAGWAPGTPPTYFPEGTGIALEAGRVIVMQVHYNFDNGPATPDRTVVELKFADGPVQRARMIPMPYTEFQIPAGATDYRDGTSITLPVGATVYGVFPHMHTLGRKISVRTQSTCLVDIQAWDFNWQQFYFFDVPGGVQLSAGETLSLDCTWDNPTDRVVTWGDGTHDEMCLNYFYATF